MHVTHTHTHMYSFGQAVSLFFTNFTENDVFDALLNKEWKEKKKDLKI